VTEHDTDPVLLRSVAEQLATEAADFVRRRRIEVSGTPARRRACGAVKEHTDLPRHGRRQPKPSGLLRDRLAELRPGDTFWARRKADRPAVLMD